MEQSREEAKKSLMAKAEALIDVLLAAGDPTSQLKLADMEMVLLQFQHAMIETLANQARQEGNVQAASREENAG